jgi:hypothetical protein
MSDFMTTLSYWRGRFAIQSELESRGFMIPRHFQELVASECSPDSRCRLDVFWDEVAREYICNRGHADSARRLFSEDPSYRSKYLDELDALRTPSPLFKVTPLHPCLKEYSEKLYTDRDFGKKVIDKIEDNKRPEISKHGGPFGFPWTGSKAEVGLIFADLMTRKGFRKSKKSFVKKSSSGLFFGGFADTGGRSRCTAVPFHFFIAKDQDMVEMFELSFDRVIPGFWYYYRFDGMESAALGFRAHVEMIDIMSESFSLEPS